MMTVRRGENMCLTRTVPGHSYHFRGKPELLAGISEENLLVQLEIEYQGDITSCNKVAISRLWDQSELETFNLFRIALQLH
jgi:hypothetical protein